MDPETVASIGQVIMARRKKLDLAQEMVVLQVGRSLATQKIQGDETFTIDCTIVGRKTAASTRGLGELR